MWKNSAYSSFFFPVSNHHLPIRCWYLLGRSTVSSAQKAQDVRFKQLILRSKGIFSLENPSSFWMKGVWVPIQRVIATTFKQKFTHHQLKVRKHKFYGHRGALEGMLLSLCFICLRSLSFYWALIRRLDTRITQRTLEMLVTSSLGY